MIRNNYSLSAELSKNESKHQGKIQSRQKYQHQMETLSKTDPIGVYRKLQKARAEPAVSVRQKKQLKKLEDNWKFILKHKLHKDKVESFLKTVENEERQKVLLQNKLWGSKSVFFNPELNPLGKVPDATKLNIESLENLTVPLKKSQITKYEPDPLIEKLGIKPPPGDPPRFYKQVYNIEGAETKSSLEAGSTVAGEASTIDEAATNDNEPNPKRPKYV